MKSHKWLYSLLLPLVMFSLSAPAAEAPADKKTVVQPARNDRRRPGRHVPLHPRDGTGR